MIIAQKELERRVVLYGISWATYQKLRDAEENYHVRMTYDRGALEIVSPSGKHEHISNILGRMVEEWTLIHRIGMRAGRNSMFRRADLRRGLEPDNCYWIRNERKVRKKVEVDLRFDPPPDLVLEVDVTRSAIPKLPIYAALGVPEIWHWKDGVVGVLRLRGGATYISFEESGELPGFPFRVATTLIDKLGSKSDTALIAEFIKSVRRRRRKT
jgi:Uma2 family endonuclease